MADLVPPILTINQDTILTINQATILTINQDTIPLASETPLSYSLRDNSDLLWIEFIIFSTHKSLMNLQSWISNGNKNEISLNSDSSDNICFIQLGTNMLFCNKKYQHKPMVILNDKDDPYHPICIHFEYNAPSIN